jgi:hypothetical protein
VCQVTLMERRQELMHSIGKPPRSSHKSAPASADHPPKIYWTPKFGQRDKLYLGLKN